jgi:MFS family permease
VANLTFLWANRLSVLYVARIAQSIGSSLTWLSAYAMVADLSPADKRGRNFGRIEQSSSQAILIGAFVFFAIYSLLSPALNIPADETMDLAWMASFTLFALLGAYALWRIRHLPETGHFQAPASFWSAFRASWRRVSSPLLVLMVIVFLTTAAFQAVSPLVLMFLQERFDASLFGPDLGLCTLTHGDPWRPMGAQTADGGGAVSQWCSDPLSAPRAEPVAAGHSVGCGSSGLYRIGPS